METTPNMNLTVWNLAGDPYDYNQLADNFKLLDQHRHTPGEGLPIPTEGIANEAVAFEKIAKGAIRGGGSGNILNGTITGGENGNLANETIEKQNIDPKVFNSIVPVGTVINWFRPNLSISLPSGWHVADGSTLAEHEHEFGITGSVTLPDLRNRFVLGAESGGPTNPTPSQVPGENATGGSHTQNLNHNHAVSPHTHTFSHGHDVQSHNHSIATDGNHNHGFQAHDGNYYPVTSRLVGLSEGSGPWPNVMHIAQDSPGGEVPGGVAPNESPEPMQVTGAHSHGGVTGASGTLGTTSQSSEITSSTALETQTNSALPSDFRPRWCGLLYLVKVSHG